MIVAIHQPDFVPWLGFYYKVSKCDIFIYLDDAQFSNEAAHNYNRIKTPQGEFKIKVPVEYHFGDQINSVKIKKDDKNYLKLLKTIEMNYSKAPFFKTIYPTFKEIYLREYNNISELNIEINKWIFKEFGFKVKVLKTSDMKIKTSKEQRIIDICKDVNADVYLSGNGAKAYQIEEHFINNGISLQYIDYTPIKYNQLWGDFLQYMSVLDYIFNCGFDWKQVEDKVKELNNGNR